MLALSGFEIERADIPAAVRVAKAPKKRNRRKCSRAMMEDRVSLSVQHMHLEARFREMDGGNICDAGGSQQKVCISI